MHRGVDITEVPLVRRNLTIGLHVPFSRQKVELLLCESWVHHSQRNTMKSGIPGREEWVFPLIGHRKNIFDMEMLPLLKASVELRIF
jgi:hypothetical protein